MQSERKTPRPDFLDNLSHQQLNELSKYLKDHDNEFVSSYAGMYNTTGYVVEGGLYRLLRHGSRYKSLPK